MRVSTLLCGLSCLFLLSACSPSTPQMETLPLIPHPESVVQNPGVLNVRSGLHLATTPAPTLEGTVAFLAAFAEEADLDWHGTAGTNRSAPISLVLGDDTAPAHAEGYRLQIAASGITLAAQTPAGLFYGLQTLRQIFHAMTSNYWLPLVDITDAPRFAYRGMHLDVARHMFPVDFIKRYIDLMAAYKMNTFHWHLTEDQGWRIEIKQYPKLTEVGAYRKETMVAKNFDPYVGDGQRYGGYYSQAEVREIVAYAQARHVTIIPEIEMPGHSTAALAAYPEFACTEGPFEVATTWGVFEDIYCPTEATFTFLEKVLTEVLDLFPSTYIHIGGDEAPKTRWAASAEAQAVMQREGLADEHALQSYFIRRIEQFLLRHNRRLIGWDEILEGGLAPEATVMSWRGMAGGIAAAQQGHDVIMTPGTHVYFDHYQGDPATEPLAIGGHTPLAKVYQFEPIPAELTPAQHQHILGAQANVWTEYMKTSEHVEYMVFPRLLALSEVVWSPQAVRNWQDFTTRLPGALQFLAHHNVNYRPLTEADWLPWTAE